MIFGENEGYQRVHIEIQIKLSKFQNLKNINNSSFDRQYQLTALPYKSILLKTFVKSLKKYLNEINTKSLPVIHKNKGGETQ